MRGCGRAVSGAFCSFLSMAPDAKEVRYLVYSFTKTYPL